MFLQAGTTLLLVVMVIAAPAFATEPDRISTTAHVTTTGYSNNGEVADYSSVQSNIRGASAGSSQGNEVNGQNVHANTAGYSGMASDIANYGAAGFAQSSSSFNGMDGYGKAHGSGAMYGKENLAASTFEHYKEAGGSQAFGGSGFGYADAVYQKAPPFRRPRLPDPVNHPGN